MPNETAFLSPSDIVANADLHKDDMDQFNALCVSIHQAIRKIPWENVDYKTFTPGRDPMHVVCPPEELPLFTVMVVGAIKVAVYLKLKERLRASGWGIVVRTGVAPAPAHEIRTYVSVYPL